MPDPVSDITRTAEQNLSAIQRKTYCRRGDYEYKEKAIDDQGIYSRTCFRNEYERDAISHLGCKKASLKSRLFYLVRITVDER
jgi:hypothetical protein